MRSMRSSVASASHGASADLEDRNGRLVLVVVDDRLQRVGVPTAGHLVEEASADDLASIGDARPFQDGGGVDDDVRLIEEDAAHLGELAEERCEQGAVPAADVHHAPEATEVVGVEKRPVGGACQRLHRPVEDRALVRTLGSIRPDVGSVDVLKGVLAGADGVLQVAPRFSEVRPSDVRGPAAQRARDV